MHTTVRLNIAPAAPIEAHDAAADESDPTVRFAAVSVDGVFLALGADGVVSDADQLRLAARFANAFLDLRDRAAQRIRERSEYDRWTFAGRPDDITVTRGPGECLSPVCSLPHPHPVAVS